MAKTANPADAHRKMLRKKEVKKNKQDRQKAREVAVVKKDTRSMEASIAKLSGANSLSPAAKAELAALQHEFAYVQKSKKDYVELHPEHRKLVYPAAAQGNADASGSSSRFGAPLEDDGLGLYAPDGRLRRPELSAYYDATFNPFGVPPPGMPYKARPPSQEELAAMAAFEAIPDAPMAEESDEEDSDDEGDDEDIEMPRGPPPASDNSSDDDEDDIPMPVGPPPSQNLIDRPLTGPPPVLHHPQPFHPNPHMRAAHFSRGYAGPRFQGGGVESYQAPTAPPVQQRAQFVSQAPDLLALGLPPKPVFQVYKKDSASTPALVVPSFFDSAAVVPSAPTSATNPAGPALPSSTANAGATITSAPNLRNLKAEAVAFVPTAVKRKKAVVALTAGAALGRIDAAPSREIVGEPGEEKVERANLLGSLKAVGVTGGASTPGSKGGQGKEDYERFLKDMKGVL